MKKGKSEDWIQDALFRYERRLVRYASRFTGDLDAARDIVQDTFLKLCKMDRSKVEDHLAPWLYTVCRNRALDVKKKEKPMTALSENHEETLSSSSPSPFMVLEGKETDSKIKQALGDLPPIQQEVVLLKFQEGLSYKEISEVTQHSVSHVGVLIHTALKTLRIRLNSEIAEERRSS